MADTLEQMMREAWPWVPPFLKLLVEARNKPFQGTHLLFSSDYSGEHNASDYTTYAFVIADADASPAWPDACKRVREGFLPDGRRMAFKNLNDKHRQRALIPFLEAAEIIEGHVVVVAVTKEMLRLSTSPNSLRQWQELQGLSGQWDDRAFEKMSRITHFFSLFVSIWTTPYTNISWITDEDDIVANENRLDDTQQFAAKLSGMYLPHPLGVFMMNTPSVEKDNLFTKTCWLSLTSPQAW